MATALKTVTAAVASAVLLSSAASAAGLGKLTVLSALGQPLRAEIELTTTAGEDASSLAVKLASPEAFRAANIEFNPALLSLRFNVEQRAGRQIIRVTSTQPLNEPFVDMLLELSWNNGRLVREYTFLLDPAELRATQPAQVAAEAPRPAAQPRAAQPAAPVAQAPQEQPRREASAPPPRAAGPAVDTPTSYRVRPGDTLGGIATRLKPSDISLDMMLVALYRANPDAFIGQNMNRLKSGQILRVPDSDTLRGTDSAEAGAMVVAHAADFNAYRNKLAGQVANAAPQRTPQAGQSAAGKITAKVEERPTAANESQDKLQLSKATQPTAGANGAATATASAEDAIAREKELAQAQARVKELERNVNDLEKLMTVKSRAGSEAENAAAAAAGAVAGVDNTPAAQAAKPAAKPSTPPKPVVPEEKSLADTLMDNINIVAGGALVLLLAALGISQRRKKAQQARDLDAEPSVLGVPTQGAHSLFAEAGGQSVDTSNSVFNSSFAPSASQLDTNEVDPVAEADVYIAYGRDAQAEEILKEALRTHPERHPVRLKLLEIYAARKDLRAFETQASELYGMTRGQGDEWAQAAALGQSIDPANPLYASATGATPVAPAQSPQERDQQSLLSAQLEDAFRGGAAPAAVLGAGAAAGAAYAAMDEDKQEDATAVPGFESEPVAARSEDNSLDFDLGGLTFEPVTNNEPIAMNGPDAGAQDETAVPDLEFALDPITPPDVTAAPAPAEEEPFDLAFDMSFGDPQPASQDALRTEAPAAAAPVDMAGLAAEFDLPPLPEVAQEPASNNAEALDKDPLFDLDSMDFGLPPTPAQPAAVAEATPFHGEVPAILGAPAPTAGVEDPLFDLDAMDFGSPAEPAPAATAQPAAEPFEFDAPPAPASEPKEEFSFDLAEPDAGDPFALPDTPAAAPAIVATPSPGVPVEPAFDMADIDLELPDFDRAGAVAAPALPEVGEALEPAAMSPEHMEMETKLDLAIAYQEIGDKEGARELLDEVIKGGSSEQVSKASAMRSLLA
ncbi:FimV/HubP family polar landmark protein [Massilia agri]|uniref:LysM peptidoglycan-binding domain-containing protein n=1 Tax=Massilia agri TaxID=1886785 RepID=A0ABT2AF46_9BURK|nr:FimV/HubP family polar landmark protein [Massilia agri]MCS0594862.1 LysM peptidoglycan-binding domain-containing protein [Massilia agri]